MLYLYCRAHHSTTFCNTVVANNIHTTTMIVTRMLTFCMHDKTTISDDLILNIDCRAAFKHVTPYITKYRTTPQTTIQLLIHSIVVILVL